MILCLACIKGAWVHRFTHHHLTWCERTKAVQYRLQMTPCASLLLDISLLGDTVVLHGCDDQAGLTGLPACINSPPRQGLDTAYAHRAGDRPDDRAFQARGC